MEKYPSYSSNTNLTLLTLSLCVCVCVCDVWRMCVEYVWIVCECVIFNLVSVCVYLCCLVIYSLPSSSFMSYRVAAIFVTKGGGGEGARERD